MTEQGRLITGPTDHIQNKARKTSPDVSPSTKVPTDSELDEVDMSLDVDTSDDARLSDVDMVDMLNRSLGYRTTRRSRSEFPSRETQTRTQHTQDILQAIWQPP